MSQTLDGSGRLCIPPHAAREIGSSPLELSSHSDRHLLFTAPAGGGGMIMSGLLGELTVADLLSFFNMFRKTGVLRFCLHGGEKALYLQQGEIVFATSTFPEEDLGEILYALGKVDRDALQKCRQFETGRATVGRILVEKGTVTPKDLWQATRSQVETIVYHLFTFERGGFSFLSKEPEKEEIVRLSMSTQNLIMEGLRRVDERGLFMRRIPSLAFILKPGESREEGLSPAQLGLVRLAQAGQESVREVLRKSGLGEFEGLRLLHQLIENGTVRIEEPQDAPMAGTLGEIFAIYNAVLTTLFRRLRERCPEFSREVEIFLRDLPQPFSYVFRDAALRPDGSLDGGRVLGNLAGLEEGDQRRLLAEAMGELVFMECEVARRELGAEGAAELVRRVQEISKRAKKLVGRRG